VFKKVTVLILSFNGKNLLDEAITSYLSNDYPEFSVIVIDNGSTDETKEWVEKNYPEVYLLRTEKNLGYSGGLNLGLEYAFKKQETDYVLITNNDVKADFKVLNELVIVAESDMTIGFVTGKVFYYDQPHILQTVGYYEDSIRWIGGHLGNQEKDVGQYDRVEERPYCDDIFILVRKELYRDIGGYDTEFKFQSEQFDWQIRAKKRGYKIFFTPFAKIWHKESMTIGKTSPFKTYYDVRNTLVVRLKYRDRDFIKGYLRWYIPNTVIKPILKNLFKLRIKYVWAIFSGLSSAIIWKLRN